MSVRLLTQRMFRHGRRIFHYCCQTRNIHFNILEHQRGRGASAVLHRNPRSNQADQISQTQSATRFNNDSRFFRFGQHARQLFVDNIINRVSPIAYSANLRADATKRLMYGDSAPFFSLIGVSLATGGILTKDDELEGVCWEIREAVSRLQSKWGREEISRSMSESFGLADLDIGPPIAKGCAAVVYAASLKSDSNKSTTSTTTTPPSTPPARSRSTVMSPIQNTSRFVHNFGASVDNLHHLHRQQSLPLLNTDRLSAQANRSIIVDEFRRQSMSKRPRVDSITESEYERVFNRTDDQPPTQSRPATPRQESSAASLPMAGEADLERYPLAVKMMFNYDIQSNAMSILRAMYKETIPARNKLVNSEADTWEKILREQTVTLPPHPNIVLMFGVFCDQVPNLAPGASLYPMALPQRLNPNGYGRNMSLFLLMKRYNYRLCDYLQLVDVQMRSRILVFAQLLEGVAHLNRYGVAHRDLKSDNILIDLNDDVHPVVVLSDFGCCLADRTHGLHMPFVTNDVDRGGNAALMAPEIIGQAAGTFSMLNYTKADLWACGTLAYEIFGQPNPFYVDPTRMDVPALRNTTYSEEDLPAMSHDVPQIVRFLVANILQRNPRKRLGPEVAANVMQLFLWAPSGWLRPDGNPSSTEILQWLLSLTTKVLCENRNDLYPDGATDADAFGYKMGRRTYTEYLLISSFLARARLETVRSAMNWIQNVVTN